MSRYKSKFKSEIGSIKYQIGKVSTYIHSDEFKGLDEAEKKEALDYYKHLKKELSDLKEQNRALRSSAQSEVQELQAPKNLSISEEIQFHQEEIKKLAKQNIVELDSHFVDSYSGKYFCSGLFYYHIISMISYTHSSKNLSCICDAFSVSNNGLKLKVNDLGVIRLEGIQEITKDEFLKKLNEVIEFHYKRLI